MQRKLTHDELLRCGAAKRAISGLPWHHMPGGRDRWSDVAQDLTAMLANGTSDGRPWVEPERPIERGDWVAVWDNSGQPATVGRYRGDLGEDPSGYRYSIVGRESLWKHVRRASDWEVADAEAAE